MLAVEVREPAPQSQSDRIDTGMVLISGTLYIAAQWWGPELLAAFGIDPLVRASDLGQQGWATFVAAISLRLPALTCIAVALCGNPRGRLKLSFSRENRAVVMVVAAATLLGSLILDAAEIWPFAWRWVDAASLLPATILVREHAWGSIALSVLIWCMIDPFLEEVVFRIGILQLISAKTGSIVGAISGSALLFAALHLIPFGTWQRGLWPYAATLFSAGVLLGVLTVYRGGRVWAPFAFHAMRNATESGSLFLMLWTSGRGPAA